MPAPRILRQRNVSNENHITSIPKPSAPGPVSTNNSSFRLTRAKAAAAAAASSSSQNDLGSKYNNSNITSTATANSRTNPTSGAYPAVTAGAIRRRPALGDVSNVVKAEGISTKNGISSKKVVKESATTVTSTTSSATGAKSSITSTNTTSAVASTNARLTSTTNVGTSASRVDSTLSAINNGGSKATTALPGNAKSSNARTVNKSVKAAAAALGTSSRTASSTVSVNTTNASQSTSYSTRSSCGSSDGTSSISRTSKSATETSTKQHATKRPASRSDLPPPASKRRQTSSLATNNTKSITQDSDDATLTCEKSSVTTEVVRVHAKEVVSDGKRVSEPAKGRVLSKVQAKSTEAKQQVTFSKNKGGVSSAAAVTATTTATTKAVLDLPQAVLDADSDDSDDPLMVPEYVVDIFDYLRRLELTTMPYHDYIKQQPELDWKSRGILVDWLLEIHGRFRLHPETLFLTVNIIDRFMSCKVVDLNRVQLVGIAAMLIASKYEEVMSPSAQNFRAATDDGFTEEDILKAERCILSTLDYDLSYPNPMNFLRRISKADNYDIRTRMLAKYLLEIPCLDHRFLKYPPSQTAAAAMYFARLVLNRGPWDSTLQYYSGYTEKQVYPVFLCMIDYLRGDVDHKAFYKKYASKYFFKASVILRQWVKQWHDCFLPLNETRTLKSTNPLTSSNSAVTEDESSNVKSRRLRDSAGKC